MVAIDTNVVIRFIVNDDPEQSERAKRLIASQQVWLSLTVLLESEWVLRRRLKLGRALAIDRLRAFSSLPNVVLEDAARTVSAFEMTGAGMDFADALHLAGVEAGQAFATFDRGFSRAAKRAGIDGVFAP